MRQYCKIQVKHKRLSGDGKLFEKGLREFDWVSLIKGWKVPRCLHMGITLKEIEKLDRDVSWA